MARDSETCFSGCLAVLVAGLGSCTPVVAAEDVAHDGLLLSWEAASLRDVSEPTSLPDGSGRGDHARLLGDAEFADAPPRIELHGVGSLVGERPIRPRRMTCEAVFRVDSTDGPLRLMAEDDCRGTQWTVAVNGTALQPAAFVRKPLEHPYEAGLGDPSQYACFSCPRRAVRDGLNEVSVTLVGGADVSIQYVDIVLP